MRTGYEKGYNVVTLTDCTGNGERGGAATFGREELSDVFPPAYAYRIHQRAVQRTGEIGIQFTDVLLENQTHSYPRDERR
jgi:hypothetical protein